MNQCLVQGCEKKVWALGYCNTHYSRVRRNGDTVLRTTPYGAPLQWIEDHSGHQGDDCLIWPFGRKSDGYAIVRVGKVSIAAHRVMCTKAHGAPATKGLYAIHSCGRGQFGCVNPRHLHWGTPADNAADRLVHGTNNHGERHGYAILTENDVRFIREACSKGALQIDMAKKFGVNYRTIGSVVNRKSWTKI